MVLTATHAERPQMADRQWPHCRPTAVRACMPLSRRLRPATCPAGPGGRRGERLADTGRARPGLYVLVITLT